MKDLNNMDSASFGNRAAIAIIFTGFFVFSLSVTAVTFMSHPSDEHHHKDGSPLADFRRRPSTTLCEENGAIGILLGPSNLATIVNTGANVHNMFMDGSHASFVKLSLKVPGLCYKQTEDPKNERNLILSVEPCLQNPRREYVFKHNQCLYSAGFVAPCAPFPEGGDDSDKDRWRQELMRYQELFQIVRGRLTNCPRNAKCPPVAITQFSCRQNAQLKRSLSLSITHGDRTTITRESLANETQVVLKYSWRVADGGGNKQVTTLSLPHDVEDVKIMFDS